MNRLKTIITLFFVFSFCTFTSFAEYKYNYLYKGLPFNMPRVFCPTFPNRTLSITDCGGIGDGKTLNTNAFAKGMQLLSAKGGGTLNVPFGVWCTGPIEFQSNINLHLEKGAIILFTTDMDAYKLVKTSYEGQEAYRCQSPISGKNLKNIAISGYGTINGSGQVWRPLKREKVSDNYWKSVINSGGVLKNSNYWFPTQKAINAEIMRENNKDISFEGMSINQLEAIKDYLRPVMISFVECKNILLQGVLFENSPSWNIHPLMCENLIVDGITIRNPEYAQNGDGIDVESCKNVILVNTTVDAGDDCICLKSGKDEEGRNRAKPTENVIVPVVHLDYK
jgi:polygalacturonase